MCPYSVRVRGTEVLYHRQWVETKKNVSENTMIRSHLLSPLPARATPGALYLQFHRVTLPDLTLSLNASKKQGLCLTQLTAYERDVQMEKSSREPRPRGMCEISLKFQAGQL